MQHISHYLTAAVLTAAMLPALTACFSPLEPLTDEDGNPLEAPGTDTRKFTFTIKGDFDIDYKDIGTRASDPTGTTAATRGYLSADGKDMTDLWVVDTDADGVVLQSLHQGDPTAQDFGQPQMQLRYGQHRLYFVASRGQGASWSDDRMTLSWQKALDTFWKAYDVEVVSTSNGNRAVTLSRAVSKLSVRITDRVPTGAVTLRVTLSRGGEQLQLANGCCTMGTLTREWDTTADIGTVVTGAWTVYTTCPQGGEEWQTDVTLQYLDVHDAVKAERRVEGVRMAVNRETSLTGSMMGSAEAFSLTLGSAWNTGITETF